MSSINTNLSAQSALQTLRATQKELGTTQKQIASGLRINEAADGSSDFNISTKMKSDKGALGAVGDSIGQSVAMIDTFSAALGEALKTLDTMKETIVKAMQPGADRAAMQAELNASVTGLKSTSSSAGFNGQKWLQGAGGPVNLVTSYDGQSKTVGRLEINTANTALFLDAEAGTGGLLGDVAAIDLVDPTTPGTPATDAELDAFLVTIDDAIASVANASSMLGANKTLLEAQGSFVTAMSDALKAGISKITDVDMNDASTRLQALQTKQELGVQALSIANQNSQMILQLFR